MARTILQMRNLGPCGAEWLDGIGTHHETDLRSVAAAAAYPERIIRGIVRPHSCPFDTFGIQLRFDSMVVMNHQSRPQKPGNLSPSPDVSFA